MRAAVVATLLVALAVVLPAIGTEPSPPSGPAAPTSPASGQKIVDHDFIGADRCRTCHQAAYDIWLKSPHARALDALTAKDRTDPRCLTCHTMVPEDVSAGLLGIQCESCHGAGRHYAVNYVMRDEELRKALNFAVVDEKSCARCHTDTSPTLSAFTYPQKLEAIRHWAAR